MKLVIYREFCSELEVFWKLISKSSPYHIFQTYEWLACWQRTIGENLKVIKPWLAVVFDEDGQPKIIFPFGVANYSGIRVLEFLGGAQGDYQGLIIDNEWICDMPKITAAWRMVCKKLPKHDVRHFSKLPEHWCTVPNPALNIWKSKFQNNSYSVILPGKFSEFQRGQRKKFRQDSRRQRKRISEKGILKFKVINDHDTRWDSAIDEMIEQKSKRCLVMGVPDIFSNKIVCDFYRVVSNQFSDKNIIHFSILELDNEIVATHWGAIYKKHFYYLMPTITSNELGVFSPGRLLLENLVEWCIQNGILDFDFTIGGEDYKRDWCDSEMLLFEHLKIITPLGLPYFMYIWLRRSARKNRHIWGMVKRIYALVYQKSSKN